MVSLAAPPATIKWIAPAPLWDAPGTTMQQPFIAEFTVDSFLPDFLAMMAGNQPVALNLPHQSVQQQPDVVYKLFQPIHMSYYLVTASLVCRKLGIPDRTVERKNGEKVSFVLRLAVPQTPVAGQPQQYTELAWVDSGLNKGWQPLVDEQNNRVVLRKDEERLPLHPTTYLPCTTSSGNGTQSQPCDARTVYFGYIPVDKREKYLVPAQPSDIAKAAAALTIDPRLDQVSSQVLEAWRSLYIYLNFDKTSNQEIENTFSPTTSPDTMPPTPQKAATDAIQKQISLNVIVDLKDFLKNNLSKVYDAIINGASIPASSPKQQALLTELQSIELDTNNSTQPKITLTDAIKKLDDSVNLAQAEKDSNPDTYDLLNATEHSNPVSAAYLAPTPQAVIESPPPEGTLYTRFREALDEEKTNNPDWLKIPPEVNSMLKNEPASGDFYWVRLVYERDPCDPVVSEHSALFGFARVFDPDAPARPIRIELPSVKLSDLRKYKRGVGMQLSPALNDILNRVNANMLQGGGLLNTGPSPDPSLGIALVCSFSIPIITLCALIVMFVFLILFNIIFWWLPFIMICFPIPKPKS